MANSYGVSLTYECMSQSLIRSKAMKDSTALREHARNGCERGSVSQSVSQGCIRSPCLSRRSREWKAEWMSGPEEEVREVRRDRPRQDEDAGLDDDDDLLRAGWISILRLEIAAGAV